MGKKIVNWLAQTWRKIYDPYNSKGYTRLTLLVPKPTTEDPLPCILVSIRNGHSKLFFRVSSIAEYKSAFELATEEEERIQEALIQAHKEADKIVNDMKLLIRKNRLPDGVKWVQTDTGEIIAEAERILKEG